MSIMSENAGFVQNMSFFLLVSVRVILLTIVEFDERLLIAWMLNYSNVKSCQT